MRTRMLSGEELSRRWYLCVESVERSLVHGSGDISAYDLFIECLAATSQCWIREDEYGVIHTVAITRVKECKQYRELVIVTTAGDGWFDGWGEECLAMLEDFARGVGCKYTSVYGRRGWIRVLEKFGYKEPYVTLMKEL